MSDGIFVVFFFFFLAMEQGILRHWDRTRDREGEGSSTDNERGNQACKD